MVEFFEDNGISPEESMGTHMHTLENLIKKRIRSYCHNEGHREEPDQTYCGHDSIFI